MREAKGPSNSETWIDVLERREGLWRYELRPITGRKHPLRVHMAALGAAIDGDRYYPCLQPKSVDDYARPLALPARCLHFRDLFTDQCRSFESSIRLP
jgi:tRNA pseudouridine32 synthase/23S rRNA pseudouridine746 synthase